MIRLLNLSKKTYKIKMTKHPISRPFESPQPTGKELNDDMDKRKQEEILSHPNYSPANEIVLKPGVNEIENDEQAEYLYMTLGNPEDGGVTFYGNQAYPVKNENFILEVDKDGNEIKDNLWKKYRINKNPLINKQASPDQFQIKK